MQHSPPGGRTLMAQTVGIIGSGMIGGAVARLAVAAGLDVVVSNSRGPESLTGLVGELGERARAGTVGQAAEADLVLAAVRSAGRAGRLRMCPVVPSGECGFVVAGRAHAAEPHIDTAPRPGWVQEPLVETGRQPPTGDCGPGGAARSVLLDALGYDGVGDGFLADSGGPSGLGQVDCGSAAPLRGAGNCATSHDGAADQRRHDAALPAERSAPGNPAFVQPYMGERPQGLSAEDGQRWFFPSRGVPVPAARVEELIQSQSQS
ncbi:NAD(P)-binding domain-containing protein [Streptomyces sp. NPDC047072]|uniref:NAD(P)-binding domain-containing protein n=1 Tax=Streptomyces sp. NPDC047072 TaxID=3154809 RepID=UPI0033E565D1